MKIYKYPDRSQWGSILERPVFETKNLEQTVSEILIDVKTLGDQAVRKYTQRFDGFEGEELLVPQEAFKAAEKTIPEALKSAIQLAIQNIRKFHVAQKEAPQVIESMPGVQCWRKSVAIEKIGLYIPGGTAPLFSTVLMLAVPAKIAGCREIILCTPPGKDGSVNPAILYAAKAVGIEKVYRIGGIQAIGAMAYGTESILAVNKIFGPGNQYVTAAKQLVNRQGIAIDLPAGPSEVLVLADQSADPAFVAADLLSQAEHGIDSQVVLIALKKGFIEQVQQEIEMQVKSLPRKEIALQALDNSVAILIKEEATALDLVNEYAPEHLILAIKEAETFAEQVINAGSVFLGNYSPESVGDYASGTNHTLPTNGYAKAYSGASLDSFVKKITFQKLSPQGLNNIGPAVEAMAEAEELIAHKNAVTLRLERVRNQMSDDKKSDVNIKSGTIETANRKPPISIDLLLRENIRHIQPYSSAREEFSGEADTYLDANENPFNNGINRYPDPLQWDVKQLIANQKGLNRENIFLGNGSDEAIDLLIRAFCEPGTDDIMILPPTYGMYKVSAAISDVGIKEIPLKPDFQPDIKSILGLGSTNSKLLFLCNPNNPTGSVIPLKTIELLIQNFSGIVVVDEAYIDFSEQGSAISLLAEYENLVILQTFSKAWGMAGARLGMAFANSAIIRVLNKIKPPYNVNQLSQQVVLKALMDRDGFETQLQEILNQKRKLKAALQSLELVQKVFPSQANFFLIQVENADELYLYLQKKSIIVRNRSKQTGCDNCLRITVGTAAENERLIEAIKVYQTSLVTNSKDFQK